MSARVGVVVLSALAPLVFLAVDPAGWFWFGPLKWLVVTTAIPLAAALVLRDIPLHVARRPTWAFGALVAWLSIAAAVGLDPVYAWLGTPERHFGVLGWALCALVFLVAQTVPTGALAPRVLTGIVIAAAAIGAVAVAEAVGWEPDPLDLGARLTGSFGSAAYLGAATALLLPICIAVAVDRSCTRRTRRLALVTFVPLVVACLGSGARAAWFGIAVAAAVVGWMRREDLRTQMHALGPRAIGGIGAGVLAVGLVVVVASPVGDRVAATFDEDAPGGRGRLDEWRVATDVVAAHPLAGVGPEGYRIAFASGADAEYERAHGRDPLPDRAHAAPLDVALAGGIPALLAWVALIAAVGRHVRRALRDERRWLVGVAAGLVAYQSGALLLFPLAEIDPVAWLLAGLVVGATATARERVTADIPLVVTPVLATLAVAAFLAGAADVIADRHARIAVDALADGDGPRAHDAAERAVARRPDEVRLHLLLGRAALADQRGTLTALAAIDDALGWSPEDPIVRRERAALLVARAEATSVPAHAAAARAELDELVAADPHNAALRALAGRAALLEGDEEGAEAAFARAEDLGWNR